MKVLEVTIIENSKRTSGLVMRLLLPSDKKKSIKSVTEWIEENA